MGRGGQGAPSPEAKDSALVDPPYQEAPSPEAKGKVFADDQDSTPGNFNLLNLRNRHAGEVQESPPDVFKGKALSDDALLAQQRAAEAERGKALIDDAKQQAAEGKPLPPPEPPPPTEPSPPPEPPPPPGAVAGGVAGTGVAYPGVEGGEEDQLPPVTQTPESEPPVQPSPPPPGDAPEGGIPGMGVPYQDFIPSIPMVKDSTTGEWRNAYESEGGYTPDPDPNPEEVGGGDIIPEYRTLPWLEGDGEEGEQTPPGGESGGGRLPGLVEEEPPVEQSPSPEPPVQPTPPPPDHGLQENYAKDYGFPGLGVEPPTSLEANLLDPIPSSGPSPFGPPSAPPSGEGEYEEQDVPPLQFGNTANLENSLDPNLLDPIAPGPTLDMGLVERITQSPGLVDRVNQDPSVAEALERDPTQIDQIEQDLGVADQQQRPMEPSGDSGPSFTDPGPTEQPLPDQSTPDEGADDLTL